jgi:transposase
MQIAEATAQRLVQEAVIAQAQERVHLILEAALFKKSNRRKNDWIELLSA